MRLSLALALLGASVAAQPTVSTAAETQRLKSSSVASGSGGSWKVDLVMDDDNGNASLPSSYRRWWHCTIGNLRPGGETLAVQVQNAGYTDIILPVWAQSSDGVTFGAFTRLPASATPKLTGSTHSFTLATPPGSVAIKLAKFFPYGVADRDALLASLAGHPRVRTVKILGATRRGYTVPLLELTDAGVPDAGKRRVWIHSGIHPAETTSYFVVEGLIGFLLGGSPAAEVLLDRLIVDVVPMANPEGVALGNYRTNSASVNLEDEWAAPYSSNEPEIVALRGEIERLMGTSSAPGGNPIEALLNLHSTHGFSTPIHYQHTANPSFNLVSSRSGVVPSVNALEGRWIAALRARSPFVALGSTQPSSCSTPVRPYVECMMHDRWSIDTTWTGAPNFLPQVMAITFEGTYGKGPDQQTWATQADWRQVGAEMALALGDFLGVLPGASLTTWGTSCGGITLSGTATPSTLTLAVRNAPLGALAVLAVGGAQQSFPLPPIGCPLRNDALVALPLTLDPTGGASLALAIPPASLRAELQALAALLPGGVALWSTSQGLTVETGR